jgi:hypothetical protein
MAAPRTDANMSGDWHLLRAGIDQRFTGYDIVLLGLWARANRPRVLQEGSMLCAEECRRWNFHVINDGAAFHHSLPIDDRVLPMLIWFHAAAFGRLAAQRHMRWSATAGCWKCVEPFQAADVQQAWVRDVVHRVWRPLWGSAAAPWAPSSSSSEEATIVLEADATNRNRKRARTGER